MLWYKGWLETRLRLLVPFGFLAYVLIHFYWFPPVGAAASTKGMADMVLFGPMFGAMTAIVLGGAGIHTQPAFQATKGLHGSLFYTLSLPVSRFRLLATRASLGWALSSVAMVALCLVHWAVLPTLGKAASASMMLQQAVVLMVCATGLHAVAVLLATFLEDQWRVFGSALCFGALAWLMESIPGASGINIFRAMGAGSPLLTQTMPWSAMAFSLGLAAILFVMALKIVQRREY